MGQRGDITIETERGEIIDSIDVRISEFTEMIYRHISEQVLREIHCLQFIDPYGDTTFNMLQKGPLVSELSALNDCLDGPQAREYLGSIIEFISKYKERVHIYVKFHGD